jgi:hypothetical protein
MNEQEMKELALEMLEDCEIVQEFKDCLWVKIDKSDFNLLMDITETYED